MLVMKHPTKEHMKKYNKRLVKNLRLFQVLTNYQGSSCGPCSGGSDSVKKNEGSPKGGCVTTLPIDLIDLTT